MGQPLLFSEPEEERQKTRDMAFDKIREKYREGSLKRGDISLFVHFDGHLSNAVDFLRIL